MIRRENTRVVHVGNIQIGGQNHIVMQSMCNIKTSHVEEVVQQILALEKLGVEMMRVSVMDIEDGQAIKEIVKRIHIPLVADIHFDYRLALLAIENGIHKIRINPGNIGSLENIKKVVEACKKHHIPIRIGVNSGSLDQEFFSSSSKVKAEQLVLSAKKHVKILEDLDFHDIVISLKGSDVLETIEAYRLAANTFPYPLHLGITEAGTKEIGIIRSVSGLAPLIMDGIGDTLRISLSSDPQDEVITMKRMLHDLGLYPNYPTLISCPTCGRTQVDVIAVAQKVQEMLETLQRPIKVAVMGCIVNGPGEASHADIGIAGGKDYWLLFEHGKPVCRLSNEEVLEKLFAKIRSLI